MHDNTDDTLIGAVLPNVNHFIVGSSHKLDSLVLTVWILLQPNLETLNISNLITFNKIELAKELNDMIDEHKHLKEKFSRIKRLIIFPTINDVDKKTKENLFIDYRKVFTNASFS